MLLNIFIVVFCIVAGGLLLFGMSGFLGGIFGIGRRNNKPAVVEEPRGTIQTHLGETGMGVGSSGPSDKEKEAKLKGIPYDPEMEKEEIDDTEEDIETLRRILEQMEKDRGIERTTTETKEKS